MCRIAAQLGAPRPLSALLYDPPHSLEVQAYRPRTMVSGHVNVDGTGLVWWPSAAGGEPLRYVTDMPPWSDANLPTLAPRLWGAMQIAAVRSATPGMPFGAATVGPFAADGLGFAHNGYVEHFERTLARPLAASLADDLYATTPVRTDSTLLFAHVRMARREAPDAGPAQWLERAVGRFTELARRAGVGANLVCILGDGRRLAACRSAVGLEPNTLYLCSEEGHARLASEPLDGRSWRLLAPDEVVELTAESSVVLAGPAPEPPRPETVP